MLRFIIIFLLLTLNFNIVACEISKDQGKKLIVFVSFSMPKEYLKKLCTQVNKAGGKIVLRGLLNNSFKDSIKYIKKEFIEIKFDIDPKLFSKFSIKTAPSFVVSHRKKYDILSGSLSLKYVLDEFIKNGELKEESKFFLNKYLENSKD